MSKCKNIKITVAEYKGRKYLDVEDFKLYLQEGIDGVSSIHTKYVLSMLMNVIKDL